MIKRPLVVLAAAYLFGIISGRQMENKMFPLLVILTVIIIFTVLLFRDKFLGSCFKSHKSFLLSCWNRTDSFLIFVPILFFSGFIQIKSQLFPCPLEQLEGKQIILEGNVVSILDTPYGYSFILEDIYIKDEMNRENNTHIGNETYTKNETIKCKNKIAVTYHELNSIKIGSRLIVTGTCKNYIKASNQGQFDEYLYYKAIGQCIKVKAKTIEIKAENETIGQIFFNLRQKLLQLYRKLLPEQEAGIIAAMLFGERSMLQTEIKQRYQQSGVSHLLSVSGLHFSLLGIALYQILRHLKQSILTSVLFSITALTFYGGLTGYSVSAKRALIMFSLSLLAKQIGCTYDLLSALSFSLICILWKQPLLLYQSNFLLSFGAVFGIAVFSPILKDCRQKEENEKIDGEISEKIKGKTTEKTNGKITTEKMGGKINKIINGFLTSGTIQLMTNPILLYFYFELPLYSVFLNIIVLPFMSALVFLAFLAGILGSFSVTAGAFLVGGSYYILKLYEFLCKVTEKLPYHTIMLGRPSILVIILYYSILFGVIALFYITKKKKVFWCLLFLLLPFVFKNRSDLRVVFLDVGQGDCIFVEDKRGTTLLIDGGSLSILNVGTYRIEPFLKSQGIEKIDYVFLSHGDKDHTNGIMELLNLGKIKCLILPKTKDVESVFEDAIKCAKTYKTEIVYLKTEDVISTKEWNLFCYYPNEQSKSAADNASSMVLRLDYKRVSFLFTGDLEGTGEKEVCQILAQEKEKEQLQNQLIVLKIAHHGSRNSTSKEFLQLIQPKVAIISCGKNNSYGHPHKELLERLEEKESIIYSTANSGAVTITTDGKKIKIKEWIFNSENLK